MNKNTSGVTSNKVCVEDGVQHGQGGFRFNADEQQTAQKQTTVFGPTLFRTSTFVSSEDFGVHVGFGSQCHPPIVLAGLAPYFKR